MHPADKFESVLLETDQGPVLFTSEPAARGTWHSEYQFAPEEVTAWADKVFQEYM